MARWPVFTLGDRFITRGAGEVRVVAIRDTGLHALDPITFKPQEKPLKLIVCETGDGRRFALHVDGCYGETPHDYDLVGAVAAQAVAA